MMSRYHYFLLVVDESLDFDPGPDFPNFHRIKLSEFQLNIPKNSGALLSHPDVIDYIEKTRNNFPAAIIPFKPSAKIEHLCREHQWLYVANAAKVNRVLEDKILFAKFATSNHLPVIPYYIGPFSPQLISECQSRFQTSDLVIQTHFGWAGQSTYRSGKTSQLTPNIPVKIMPLLSGYTLLNNCCLYQGQLLQSPPALQLTGVKNLTLNPFTTVGRQWPSGAPTPILEKIFDLTAQFGNSIKKDFNYLGFFGLDFFITPESQVYLLECNPRLTASYAFYSQLEQKAGVTPLFYYHLNEFSHDLDIPTPQDRFYNNRIIGTEITPKDNFGTTVKTIHLDHPVTTNPYEINLPNF
ncbi:hypothetical protein M1116_00420 [Patescibacteria group bacterium]|nr:hypothetical protein [Patescibacteria group bacterium]